MKTPVANPLVSIVLPCRNEQGYIQACLESALKQDLGEGTFEILIADGMSTDGTREYLQEMAALHAQIRLLDNPGRIVSTGLNNAIRAARGEIIVRMDVLGRAWPIWNYDPDHTPGQWVIAWRPIPTICR